MGRNHRSRSARGGGALTSFRWLFRAGLRQQRRAAAARGCLALIVLAALLVFGFVVVLPLLARLAALVPKAGS